jgi:hypothetical protein
MTLPPNNREGEGGLALPMTLPPIAGRVREGLPSLKKLFPIYF